MKPELLQLSDHLSGTDTNRELQLINTEVKEKINNGSMFDEIIFTSGPQDLLQWRIIMAVIFSELFL